MTLGIEFVLFIYKVFGRRVCSYLLRVVCFYYWLFALRARTASSDYIKTYRKYANKKKWKIHKINTFSHIYSFALSVLDKFAVWKGDYVRNDIKLSDRDLLKKLSEEPQGALFIGAHFGNMEIARAVGRENPNKVYNALVHTENAIKFNRCLSSLNGDSSLNMIEVKNFNVELSMQLKERISQGEWLFIVGDRTSVSITKKNRNGSPLGDRLCSLLRRFPPTYGKYASSRCKSKKLLVGTSPRLSSKGPAVTGGRVVTKNLSLDFLGKSAEFPFGPFLLGYLLEAPVYSFFCYKEGRELRVLFKNILPDQPCTSRNKMEYIESMAENYVKELEYVVCREPKQWFNFFKFWRDL